MQIDVVASSKYEAEDILCGKIEIDEIRELSSYDDGKKEEKLFDDGAVDFLSDVFGFKK